MISTLTLAGFLVGVSLLQQQASLPALPWLFLPLILLAFMLFCWAKLKPLVQWVFFFWWLAGVFLRGMVGDVAVK